MSVSSAISGPRHRQLRSSLAPTVLALAAGLLISALGIVRQEGVMILAALAVYGLSFCLIYSSTGTLRIISPTYLSFLFYSVYLLVGTVMLVAQGGVQRWVGAVRVTSDGGPALLAVTLGMLSFAAGVRWLTLVLRFTPAHELRAFAGRAWIDDWNGRALAVAVTAVAAVGAVMAATLFTQRGLPALAVVGAGSRDVFVASLALGVTRVKHGGLYLMQSLTIGLPLCTLALCAKAATTQVRAWAFAALCLGVANGLMLASFTGRDQVVIYVLLFLVFYQYLAGRMRWRRAAPLLALLVLLFGGLTVLKAGAFLRGKSVQDAAAIAASALRARLMLPARELQAVLQSFPLPNDHLYGRSYVMSALAMRPGPDVGFSGWLGARIYHVGPSGVSLAPDIVAESYVDLGWFGIGLVPFAAGACLQALYVSFLRSRKRISTLVLFTILSTYFAKAVRVGLGGVIFEPVPEAVGWFTLLALTYALVRRSMPSRDTSLRPESAGAD